MEYYIGIDLGTTNSAICSYDGTEVRIWKSPEQNDVTPSAIYIDKRGHRYYGRKAYNQASYNPDNSATLFKRFMGTNNKIEISSAGISLTPEECSAEILKVLYGYLPEEIRNNKDTAIVITVPAAFNQMKKDATLEAARLAGIGNVALMQEPVAAIMSIMRNTNKEGIFLVYDLGGGTFDVSIAENINGKVNLLAHGGVEMCGGRDIDRMLFNNIVRPWLTDHFNLPDDLRINNKYRKLCRIAEWATERAKIELSANEVSTIALSEDEVRTFDESGEEIYIDIDISRPQVNQLIKGIADETIAATRETLHKTGITANDIERIVFVGGPTNYKPLRDMISEELSVRTDIDVNPMTAVAEGASIFAESIDWSSVNHDRKAVNDTVKTDIDLSLKYTARTTDDNAKIMCIIKNELNGYTIQFDSLDTGWTSGRIVLKNKQLVKLPLGQKGENRFGVTVYDAYGKPEKTGIETITITRTFATIAAIPASSSVGIEVIDRLGGTSSLEYLVKEGEPLPKKGTITVKAGQTIKAGTNDSLNIKLWEGNIQNKIEDNRFIGVVKVTGNDIESGVIPTGADIECDYTMADSGTLNMEVTVPCIGAVFSGHNFYSRQEGQDDIDIDKIADEGRDILKCIDEIAGKVGDERIDLIRAKAANAAWIDTKKEDDEDVQKANNDIIEARKLLNTVRQNNLKVFRQIELNGLVETVEEIRVYANPFEVQSFERMISTAQRKIDRNDSTFETEVSYIRDKILDVLLKQDWYIIDLFGKYTVSPDIYVDKERFFELKSEGEAVLARNDIDSLRHILSDLFKIMIYDESNNYIYDIANIVKR